MRVRSRALENDALPYIDQLGLVDVRLGSYVVREVVAQGGVAVIYRGEHQALRSAVAVKVLTPELVEAAARPTLEQMFLREAQILSQLRSDDILRALDHGRVVCPADGLERPYIVVDWLDGTPLSDELDARRTKPPRPYGLAEAIQVLEPIARALAACHASGIVHRDVNPRNVFLETTSPGTPPRAKLIDFGFAKEVARTESLRLQQVSGTLFARSPDYAAPEHYDRDKYGELSENTDIYTLALMLVEMMTLSPPLRGITDSDLFEATIDPNDRPTPNNRGANVPPAVEALFAEALAIDQLERPGDVLGWWERLKAAASGVESPAASASRDPRPAPVPAPAPEQRSEPAVHPASPSPVPPPPARPSRNLLFPALSVFALGAAAAGAFWWSTRPLTCPPGFADCNGERGDGCETDLRGDVAHCGACRNACDATHGAMACSDGKCRIAACSDPGLADCNGLVADGCEVNTATDPKHCGACGNACGTDGAKSAACAGGKCRVTCEAGFGDCDARGENGCETNLSTTAEHCGRCGRACADEGACVEGLCEPKVLVASVDAQHLALENGQLYFWNAADNRIERVGADGKRTVMADRAVAISGLAVGDHRLVWAGGPRNEIFGRALSAEDSPVRRIAGPLITRSPLVVASNGYVSWTNRGTPPSTPKPKRGKRGAVAKPPAHRAVFTAPVDAVLDPSRITTGECDRYPGTFAGDDRAQYCCEGSQPLTRVECKGGQCTHHPYHAVCPEEIALDAENLYFAQDVRVLALEPESGKMTQLAKRKRKPRRITLGGGHVYWIEGDRTAELYRVSKTGAGLELLARGQVNVTSLAASDGVVYWVARTAKKDGASRVPTSIYALPLQ